MPIEVRPINRPEVKEIRIGYTSEVYKACYRLGGKNDQGGFYGINANFGGCYDPETRIIWVNRDCDIKAVLKHEECHAYSGLSDKECDDRNPVQCQFVYQFEPPGAHIGGRLDR